ncbi:MAG TPA: polysaccharide deacetylase family protein [Bacteroidota bacterium]
MLKRTFQVFLILALFLWSAMLTYKYNVRTLSVANREIVSKEPGNSVPVVNIEKKTLLEYYAELPDSALPFSRGLKSVKELALSFDACPTSGMNRFNKDIANTLLQTRTPATIFLSGLWVKEDSDATRLLASDTLIELGNHSFYHPHLTHLPEAKMRQELQRTQDIISRLTRKTPFLFRAPYGEYNDTLITVAKQLGLITVQFSVESGDPDTTFTTARLTKWVTSQARNGSIIIMHINNRGWHTAEALPTIIANLRREGYRLVKVSDLMRDVREQSYQKTVAGTAAK